MAWHWNDLFWQGIMKCCFDPIRSDRLSLIMMSTTYKRMLGYITSTCSPLCRLQNASFNICLPDFALAKMYDILPTAVLAAGCVRRWNFHYHMQSILGVEQAACPATIAIPPHILESIQIPWQTQLNVPQSEARIVRKNNTNSSPDFNSVIWREKLAADSRTRTRDRRLQRHM